MDAPSVIIPGVTTKHWLSAGRTAYFKTSRKPNSPIIRIFGYSRAVARTNSHFGGVEVGTEFAISDLRSRKDQLNLVPQYIHFQRSLFVGVKISDLHFSQV